MNLQEFKEEFNFKYDAASKGGPDIDDYEMSLMLTQAVKDITEAAIASYETEEASKRLIAGLLKYYTSTVTAVTSARKFLEYNVTLPEKLIAILREEPEIESCASYPEIVSCRVDEFNSLINNPFKRPSFRKVLRMEKDKSNITVFSSSKLKSYKITYIKEIKPIIISTLDSGLSIEGITTVSQTELPNFIHSKIIDIAVMKTIKTVRSNYINGKQ